MLKNKDDALVQSLGAALDGAVKGRSPLADARARFMRNRAAVVSLLVLGAIVLLCLIGPVLLPPAMAGGCRDRSGKHAWVERRREYSTDSG